MVAGHIALQAYDARLCTEFAMETLDRAMLRHYVFLKHRDGTSDEHVAAFCERMLALRAYQRHPQHVEVMAFNAPSWRT